MLQEYSGQQVRLRPLEDDDLDAVMRLYRFTPNYWSAIGYGRDPVSKIQLQTDFWEAQRTEGRQLYAIVRRTDNALIGVADVQLEATMSDTATIALLLIGGPYQQHGFGSEAADLLEQSLFAARGTWSTYKSQHQSIVDLDTNGRWDEAVAAATSDEPGC